MIGFFDEYFEGLVYFFGVFFVILKKLIFWLSFFSFLSFKVEEDLFDRLVCVHNFNTKKRILFMSGMVNPKKILNNTSAEDLMKSLLINIKPSDLATRARKIIGEERIQTLPVTSDEKLVGMIRGRDLLRITSDKSNAKVSQLMVSPVIEAMLDLNVADLCRKVFEFDVLTVPVIDDSSSKNLQGIVELEDVLFEIAEFCGEKPEIREIITSKVIKTGPEENIAKVWRKMQESDISGIPVMKENKPVGMVTRLDILRTGKARLSTKPVPKVKKIMKSPVIKINSDDSLKKAAKKMANQDIGRLPVMKDEKLEGIVDREDIITFYL